jgi:hypothetical protein
VSRKLLREEEAAGVVGVVQAWPAALREQADVRKSPVFIIKAPKRFLFLLLFIL